MQRASHQRTASQVTMSPAPNGRTVHGKARRSESTSSGAAVEGAPVSEVKLSPGSTFTKSAAVETDEGAERRRQLSIAIRQRI